VYFYTGGKLLRSPCVCSQMPCLSIRCKTGQSCMAHMNLDEILDSVVEILGESPTP